MLFAHGPPIVKRGILWSGERLSSLIFPGTALRYPAEEGSLE